MLDYIRALQLRFVPPEYHEEIDDTYHGLSQHLDKEDQKTLLHLMDQWIERWEDDNLRNFTEGLKLGLGLMTELREDGLYDFVTEEEDRACRLLWEEREARDG